MNWPRLAQPRCATSGDFQAQKTGTKAAGLCMVSLARTIAVFAAVVGCGESVSHDNDGPPDPRIVLDGCGLPQPCGTPSHSHTTEDLWPFEDAACIHHALASAEAVHFTIDDGYRTTLFDFYVGATGSTIRVTSRCEEDGICTDYDVERCTLLDLTDLECSGCNLPQECQGGITEPSERVCGSPGTWCSQVVAIEAACP